MRFNGRGSNAQYHSTVANIADHDGAFITRTSMESEQSDRVRRRRLASRWSLALAGCVALVGCGGGGGGGGGGTPTYTIGGTVTGLSGSVVLLDNGGNSLTVKTSGTFQFSTALSNGAAYAVTVGTQPADQNCTVSSGSGTVASANVTSVAVSCTTTAFTIGGTVTGLSGSVVLLDNGGNSLTVKTSGTFQFSTALSNGAAYAVTVGTQPADQNCTVSSGSGTVASANVTNVAVSCTTTAFTIGGTASGVTAAGLVLKDNGGNNLTVAKNGSFTFSTALATGAMYAVTVATPPAGETCSVTNGSGTVAGANVTNVAVGCSSASASYTIGGAVTGLSGTGLVLQDNGGDNFNVSANGTFTFATALANGAAYAVAVQTQPTSTAAQYCIVTNSSGTVAAANITNVAVTCRNTGQWVYVTTTYGGASGMVTLFQLDPTTGLLSRTSRYTTSPPQPVGVALDTFGNGYLAAEDSTDVQSITQNSQQAIVDESDIHNSAGTSTFVLALDPNLAAPYLFVGGSSSGVPGCKLSGSGALFNYSYASSGVLTALASGPYTLDANPCGLVTDPTGQVLYVAIPNASEIVAFSISAADGSLTELNGGAPFTFQGGVGNNTPYALAMHPTAAYLFITDITNNTVSVYSYSASTGAITLVGSPYPVGNVPESVTVDPSGQFVYVANAGDGSVSAFTISAQGALTAVAGSPFTTGQGSSTTPIAVAVEPSGEYAYVTNGDAMNVSIFGITPGSGVLTDIDAAPSACPNGLTCTVGGDGGSGGASALAIQ